MANIIIDSHCGDTFGQVALHAKQAARQTLTAEFEFNGIQCLVNKDTNLEWLFRDYCNAHMMKWATVGPHCVESYPEEVQQQIDKRTCERDAKLAREQQQYKEQQQAKTTRLQEKIKDTPFDCTNNEKLTTYKEKNTDPYGAGIVEYAVNWGRLMQLEMQQGNQLSEIAEKTSSEADTYGITGFMYGAAVKVLVDTWKHGEKLRVWHNRQYNHSGDGVVNPAILTLK